MGKLFKLKENGTTVRTEIVAGLTTFMTMAYIIALNPNLLTAFGANGGTELWNGVFLATCIASAIGMFVMAFLANKPFALAPGMGLNSFFAIVVSNIVSITGLSYTESFQAGLCIILIEGIIFFILSVLNVREKIVQAIPLGVRLGIAPAIGLMLMNIGFGSNAGIYSDKGGPFYVMRDFFGSLTPGLARDTMGSGYSAMVLAVVTMFIGLFVIIILAHKKVKGAVLLGMLASCVIYWAGEAAAVQLDHGAQVRRQHRQHIHDHPLGAVAGNAEGLDGLQTLQDAHPLLAGGLLHLSRQLGAELVEVDLLQQVLNGLSAHCSLELITIALPHLAVLFLGQQLLLFQRGQAGIGDDIACKVEDLLQQAGADVQHQADAAGDALEVPDVAHRSGQLDVAHTLTANLGLGHLDAAAVADLALITDALILAAVALPVLGRSKNALAVQAVALRLQGAVVDGLGLLHLTVAPLADLLRRGKADFNGIENVVFHETNPFLISSCFDDTGGFSVTGSQALLPCRSTRPRGKAVLCIQIRNLLRQKQPEPRHRSYRPPAQKDHRNLHRRP